MSFGKETRLQRSLCLRSAPLEALECRTCRPTPNSSLPTKVDSPNSLLLFSSTQDLHGLVSVGIVVGRRHRSNSCYLYPVRTEQLRVLAIGTIFDNVVLQKDVSFDAFNGLPGVTIVNPDFPRDSQDPKGIALVTQSSIPSPSNLGIELGTATFEIFYEGVDIGPVSANGLTLAPKATTNATLEGTIVEQRSQNNLNSLGRLFSQFLADADQVLQVRGKEVISPAQPDSPVDWLSSAFKQLTLNVVLPGQRYEIISAVQLQDLTIRITEQSEAYAVPSQNNETDITFKNPFGFSLGVAQAGGAFTIIFNGVDTALLTLPKENVVRSEVSTGQDVSPPRQQSWAFQC